MNVSDELERLSLVSELVNNKQIKVMRCLKPHLTIDQQRWAIHLATQNGYVEVLKLFITEFDIGGTTLVHEAAKRGYAGVVQFLLQHSC